eukprot:s3888_g6.t1
MGNSVADRVASKAIQRCPLQLKTCATNIAQHQKDQADALSCVFNYLVEMNTERKMLTLQNEQAKTAAEASSSSRHFMGQEALTAMINYSCDATFSMDFSAIDDNLLKANLQGYNLARFIVKWAQSLQWPPEDISHEDDTTKMISQWGISWFELYTNFLITTGQHCPVRISGSLADTIFVPFDSDEARLQPSLQRYVLYDQHLFFVEASTTMAPAPQGADPFPVSVDAKTYKCSIEEFNWDCLWWKCLDNELFRWPQEVQLKEARDHPVRSFTLQVN